MNPIVVIPARLAATRLPDKPLADIHGEPMIVHVWRRAMAAAAGPVLVACGDAPIAAAIERVGGTAVLTDPALPSGSDRVQAALQAADPDGRYDIVINLQGDLPTLEPQLLHAVLAPLAEPAVDIATLAVEIRDEQEALTPSVVKVAIEPHTAGMGGNGIGRALYFSRLPIPSGDGPRYHHIGIYAYRRAALARFVTLPPGKLEAMEKLEQLRAMAAGMRIDVQLIRSMPFGVDTPADLERARAVLGRPI